MSKWRKVIGAVLLLSLPAGCVAIEVMEYRHRRAVRNAFQDASLTFRRLDYDLCVTGAMREQPEAETIPLAKVWETCRDDEDEVINRLLALPALRYKEVHREALRAELRETVIRK